MTHAWKRGCKLFFNLICIIFNILIRYFSWCFTANFQIKKYGFPVKKNFRSNITSIFDSVKRYLPKIENGEHKNTFLNAKTYRNQFSDKFNVKWRLLMKSIAVRKWFFDDLNSVVSVLMSCHDLSIKLCHLVSEEIQH